MDITLATDTITLSHTGGSDVYVTGYKTVAIPMSDDDEDEYGRGPYLGSSDDEGGEQRRRAPGQSSRVDAGGWLRAGCPRPKLTVCAPPCCRV